MPYGIFYSDAYQNVRSIYGPAYDVFVLITYMQTPLNTNVDNNIILYRTRHQNFCLNFSYIQTLCLGLCFVQAHPSLHGLAIQ